MANELEADTASGPKQCLVVLVRLQNLDEERDRKERLVEQGGRLVQARTVELAKVKAQEAAREDNLKHARANAHEAEVDLKEQSEKIQKFELQLSAAKTNQEYQALQVQIETAQGESATTEEAALVLYENIEEAEAALGELKKRVSAGEAALAEFTRACEKEREESLEEISLTDGRRDQLLSELPADIRSNYEVVREAREGSAVVACESHSCGGCGTKITPNHMAKLIGCVSIISCDSCQRILYAPEVIKLEEGA